MRAFDVLAKGESEIRNSMQPRFHLEMTLLRWIHLRKLVPLSDLIDGLEKGAPAPRAAAPVRAAAPPRPPAPAPPRALPVPVRDRRRPRHAADRSARPNPLALRPPENRPRESRSKRLPVCPRCRRCPPTGSRTRSWTKCAR